MIRHAVIIRIKFEFEDFSFCTPLRHLHIREGMVDECFHYGGDDCFV
jgi:hypothetical protein